MTGLSRRALLIASSTVALGSILQKVDTQTSGGKMYGVIGKITATPGQRDALAAVLLEGTQAMPGCLSYVVARDSADADSLWITEVWDSPESHKASLSLTGVRTAIAKGRPLIAAFANRTETVPIGGHGLSQG